MSIRLAYGLLARDQDLGMEEVHTTLVFAINSKTCSLCKIARDHGVSLPISLRDEDRNVIAPAEMVERPGYAQEIRDGRNSYLFFLRKVESGDDEY